MFNSNLNQLEKKYHELLINLSEEELKQYIQVLARNYYISFLSNDLELYNNTFKQLEEVNSIYRSKYSNFNNYINFCLLAAVNSILNENITSEVNLELLETSEESYFSEEPFQNLINAFNESRALYFKQKEAEERIEELEKELAAYRS